MNRPTEPARQGPVTRKLTKHRTPGTAGGWSVHADGHDTGLRITQGESPGWGQSQEWDVTDSHDDNAYLFSARGLGHAMTRLETVAMAVAWAGFR